MRTLESRHDHRAAHRHSQQADFRIEGAARAMMVPLLCFPFAGAGASFFSPWLRFRLPNTRVHPVQLPGREKRVDETPYSDVMTAVTGLVDALITEAELGNETPVALFGHSLGAVLAYEMARHLQQIKGIPVAHLFVSGSPGPMTQRSARATGLPDEEFLARVREFADFDHPAFADGMLLELLLPALRADVAMHEDYVADSDSLLDTPITSIRGIDDSLVSSEQARQWAQVTSARFRLAEIPGGHMYLTQYASPLLRFIDGSLKRAVRS